MNYERSTELILLPESWSRDEDDKSATSEDGNKNQSMNWKLPDNFSDYLDQADGKSMDQWTEEEDPLKDSIWSQWMREWIKLLQLACPVILTYLLETWPGMVCIMFIGHMEDSPEVKGNYLAAAALATMYLNVTGMSIGFGLATAMDTLCSQAYGANQKKLLGIILQRGVLILMVSCLPSIVLWMFAENVLIFLKQDPVISELAGSYCRWSVLSLPSIFLYEALKKYLQAQGIVKPTLYIALISNFINIFANWLLIYGFRLGFLGAPLARCLCSISLPLMTIFYLRQTGIHKETWSGVNWKEATSKWYQFFQLAIPGMLMTCLEWWAFEIISLAVGIFGDKQGTELASQTIIVNTNGFTYMVPLGIAVASTVRVGHFLGAKLPSQACRTARLAILMIVFLEIGTSILLILFRSSIPKAFTIKPAEIELVRQLIPIVAGFQLFDGIQGVCSGILRGCGRQKTGALLNLLAYYGIGIPLALGFAFLAHLRIFGIWWGMFMGLVTSAIINIYLQLKMDWKRESMQARQRVAASMAITERVEGSRSERLYNFQENIGDLEVFSPSRLSFYAPE